MSNPWNVHQQVFGLSLLANSIRQYKGNTGFLQGLAETTIANYLAATPGLKGWNVTWGPVVWKHDPNDESTGPDNVWFVAYNPKVIFPDQSSKSLSVVAIAATAPGHYDWIFEDLEIQYVVDFMKYIPTVGTGVVPVKVDPAVVNDKEGTYMSLATAHGVYVLDSVPAPSTAKSPGTTLLQALSGTPGYAHIIFTGHSLGGALSPTLALAYVKSGKLPPVMSVMTYPSAGATPGNRNFVSLYKAAFPGINPPWNGEPYQTWNLNAVNLRDIVPHAWCYDPLVSWNLNLGMIPPIYGTPVIPQVEVDVAGFIELSRSSKVLYAPLPHNSFPGIAPEFVPRTMKEFFNQVGIEHGEAYAKWAGLTLPSVRDSEAPGTHKVGAHNLSPPSTGSDEKEVSGA